MKTEASGENILMEIHSVHIPALKNGLTSISNKLDSHSALLNQIAEIKQELAGSNKHLESISETLKGLGRSVMKAAINGFGFMLAAICVVVVVSMVAITKIEFSGEGAGFKANIGQSK